MANSESKARHPSSRAGGLLISLITIFMMLGLGEIYFRYINLQSDGFYFTLMAQRWNEVCWKPTFTLKSDQYPKGEITYRDRVWMDADVAGKKKIMIVGDSVAAGLGVCDAKQRFGDMLQAKLGNQYAVFNVAYPGWDTPDEAQYAPLYPYQPDVVVLSYFVNDIGTAMMATHPINRIMAVTPWWANAPVLKDSYLLDYVYWQIIYKRIIYRQQYAVGEAGGWQADLDSYFVPDTWELHRKAIERFIAWAKQGNRPVIVIVWPRLDDIESSVRQVELVKNEFKTLNVTLVDGLAMFRQDSPRSLVVSAIDAHPNENTHRRMAEALYQAVQQLSG